MEDALRSRLFATIVDILTRLDALDALINDMKIDPSLSGVTESMMLTVRSTKAEMLSSLAWAFRELEDIEDLGELKAQLSYLVKAIDELAEAGYDVSDFNTWLEKTRKLIQGTKKEN